MNCSQANGQTAVKFPPIDNVSLDDARAILRAASRNDLVGIMDVIRIKDCDAVQADSILRAVANAGYLRAKLKEREKFSWERTALGIQLVLHKKRRRITREQVKSTLSELVKRAQAINSDPERLQRITLQIFGSTLRDQEDYGDVDVSIAFYGRSLDQKDRERITDNLTTRQSESERRTAGGQTLGATLQDRREIRAILTKGLAHVSLMSDKPMELGTPFRWLVNHDIACDLPIDVSDAVSYPDLPSLLDAENSRLLPDKTIMEARHRRTLPEAKVPTNGLHIFMNEAAFLEANCWTPVVTPYGTLAPNDLRHDPTARFAGFQHLCPIWKEPVSGLTMLRRALKWCCDHEVWVRETAPIVSIFSSDREQVIELGMADRRLRVEVGPKSLDSYLMPRNKKHVSKIDLAGAYAVARSLGKIYRETRSAKMPPFSATLLLPSIDLDGLPEFPELLKTGNFREGVFGGLLEAELLVLPPVAQHVPRSF